MFSFEFFTHPVVIAIYSLLMGSFLTACIYRIPYGRPIGIASLEADEDELAIQLKESTDKVSIFSPARSFCPKCNNQIYWWHNIPVLSWIILKGKCYFCKAPISYRYPLVELLSLAFAMLSYCYFSSWTAVLVYLFCCALIVLSFIDLDYFILPDVMTIPGIVLGFIFAIINHLYGIFDEPFAQSLLDSCYGFLLGGGFLWGISKLFTLATNKVGLGFGDVKLMAMAGLFFGPADVYEAIFLGSLAGAILGIIQLKLSKKEMGHPIPFGPYLALGIVLSIFIQQDLMSMFVIR